MPPSVEVEAVPPSEVEHVAPSQGVEKIPPLCSTSYELFRSKNKIEIESQLPLGRLVQNVKKTWSDDSTFTTAASTADYSLADLDVYMADTPSISVPTPKRARPDPVPSTFAAAQKIGGKNSNVLLRALFDSGSTRTLIHRSAVPEGVQLESLGTRQRLLTVAGEYT